MMALMHGLKQTFQAFSNRHYTYLWLANTLSYMAGRMQMILLVWFVLRHTNSTWHVSLLGFFSTIPIPFTGLIGGLLADRMDRRCLMIVTQTVSTVISLTLTILLIANAAEVWHAYLVALITGTGWALRYPVRRAFVYDLIGESGVTNAVALDNVGMNVSRVAGPACIGGVIAWGDIALGYAAVTTCYIAGLIWLGLIRVRRSPQQAIRTQTLLNNLIEGFHYVRQQPAMMAVVISTAIMNLLLFPYIQMVPVLARDFLHSGPTLVGILTAAEGVGLVLGSMLIASLQRLKHHGTLFLSASFLAWAALLGFALSKGYGLSVFTLVLLGLGTAGFTTLQAAIVILGAPEEARGRVLGVMSIAFGVGPLGSLLIGAVANTAGLDVALGLNAVAGLIAFVGIVYWFPSLRAPLSPSHAVG